MNLQTVGEIQVAQDGRRWQWRVYCPHLDDVIGRIKYDYWGGSARSRKAAVRAARRCRRRYCPKPKVLEWQPETPWPTNVLPETISGEAAEQPPLAIVVGNPQVRRAAVGEGDR